jgi:hypothetical protein
LCRRQKKASMSLLLSSARVYRSCSFSNIAKLLYLAQRARPDVLLAVFLTTRVSSPDIPYPPRMCVGSFSSHEVANLFISFPIFILIQSFVHSVDKLLPFGHPLLLCHHRSFPHRNPLLRWPSTASLSSTKLLESIESMSVTTILCSLYSPMFSS